MQLRKGGPGCPAGWARFEPNHDLPNGFEITVQVRRATDSRTLSFSYANDGKHVYTNLLLTRSGCLTASVLLGDPAAPVGSATTRCLSGPTG